MATRVKIASLAIGAIYRRVNTRVIDPGLWTKLDNGQHGTAVYDSIAERWEIGWLPERPMVVEDFNGSEEVEPH